MFAYVVKRVLAGIVVLVLVSMAIFLLFWYGPESPAQPICDQQTSNRCGDRIKVYEERLGYNNPVYEEYVKFVKGIFVGREIQIGSQPIDCPAPCMGISYRTTNLVSDEMAERIPATLSVALGGAFFYLLFGIPIGVAAARRRGSVADKALVASFLTLSSIPYYLFALLTWLYLTVIFEIPIFSNTGYMPFTENPLDLVHRAVPRLDGARSLRLHPVHPVHPWGDGRGAERGLHPDRKAKGLPTRTVVYRHGLRAALVPVVTIFGIDFGILLSGTIFTERIFEIDGIGFWGLEAVRARDLPVVAATALFGATIIIISNIVVDMIYSILDPRVRLS